MRSERALINHSRSLSRTPYLLGEAYSDTDNGHAFCMYWRMILGRHSPSPYTIFGDTFWDNGQRARQLAREAAKRLRAGWYIYVNSR